MPVQYKEFVYDYQKEALNFVQWLEQKDAEGWQFITFGPNDFSNNAYKHIVQCLFVKK